MPSWLNWNQLHNWDLPKSFHLLGSKLLDFYWFPVSFLEAMGCASSAAGSLASLPQSLVDSFPSYESFVKDSKAQIRSLSGPWLSYIWSSIWPFLWTFSVMFRNPDVQLPGSEKTHTRISKWAARPSCLSWGCWCWIRKPVRRIWVLSTIQAVQQFGQNLHDKCMLIYYRCIVILYMQ